MSFASVPKARVRGRPFAGGNSGRPVGAKNGSTLIWGALLQGDSERLVRKGIEMALNGDPQMLKFFLSRILPRERVMVLDLPKVESADDTVAHRPGNRHS
jgi:hypothetical protein